jgi:excisionase family DNA binding protein
MQDRGTVEIVTPPALAKELGVSRDKVLGWIKAGELEAVNLAANRNGRPRYGITRAAVQAFLGRRAVVKRATPHRRPKPPTGLIEFF